MKREWRRKPAPSEGSDVTGNAAAAAQAAAQGLVGPGSLTWRIMGEPVIWVAGLRALYLHALHPRVMRGTWQNTSFARPGEAWGRFVRTTEFVSVRTYGTTEQVDRPGRRVRQVQPLPARAHA